jgi:hypothetical protein
MLKPEDESLRKDPVFRILLEQSDDIVRDAQEYQEYFTTVWERDHGAIGQLVRAHLVLEHFLAKYLCTASPALGDIGAARLTFAQKLELALNPASVLVVIGPGMKQINKLRNQLVHRLEFRLQDADLEPLRWFIRIRNEGVGLPVPDGIELIEEFTKTACTFLAGAARSIEKNAGGMGLPGLNKWWRDEIARFQDPNGAS